MSSLSTDKNLHNEYREMVENDLLGDAIRNAMLLFFFLQTFIFIPADWILFPERFTEFLVARLAENGLLAFLYFKWSYVSPVQSTAISSLTGSALFLYMVHVTGGVESGYYVGIILLLVGIAVLTPLSGRQSSLIAGTICVSYASLPWISHAGHAVNWPVFAQHLFFLGSACIEAGLACLLMDRMRFNDFCQRRELTKARDELAELDKAKSRFSANVHHELRTPLTLILSPLDALRSGEFGEIPSSVMATLDTMHSNGRRLHKMINNLLDLSKIEGEQFRIVRRPTRIDRLVNELVSGARPMAARKGVEISVLGLEQPVEIAIDSDAIEKVVVNLLGNALKFTEKGGSIEIKCVTEDDGFALSVSDTGIGIPPDQIDSIFNRFAQVDSSSTRNYEGTGIGLSLAEEMISLHGGKIWAESGGEGLGTTIHFWLPEGLSDASVEDDVLATDSGHLMSASESVAAIEADLNLEFEDSRDSTQSLDDIQRHVDRIGDQVTPNRGNSVHDSDDSAGDESSNASVLIAEDNPDMRRLLESLVGRHYRVRTARNGREALEFVHEEKPDLILSDVMMPEMDGTELCRRIKDDSETASIPVVLVTSKAENEMKLEGLELGANDYVTKPFHPRELLARIGSLIRSSVLRRELAFKNEQLTDALDELQRAEVRLIQNERLAAVGELAAGIAHEVNNPVNFALNGARALSQAATEIGTLSKAVLSSTGTYVNTDHDSHSSAKNESQLEVLTNDVIELAEIVTEGLERTQTLVADLRDFASPDNKERTRVGVDVASCLRSAINLMQPTFSESHIEISFASSGDPRTVEADSGAIGQVFLNLLKNACDAAAPNKSPQVGVRIAYSTDSVDILISDNGPGIEDDARARIFEPFFTTKRPGEGTGLGLAISRRIIADHGGVLDFSSHSDEGTTFHVQLPLAE
jgi:signal transduction histidine kinase